MASSFYKPIAKQTSTTAKNFYVKGGATAPAENPWQPVLSFGQTLIDIVSTPLYFVEGAVAGAQKGKNPITSAAENSIAWTQGKRPQTGSDILKNAGMSNDFWSSLAADIALDPLTYTPGVVISAPIKAVLAGTKYGLKGAVAATKGAVTPIVAKGAKSVGEAITPKVPQELRQLSTASKAQRNVQLLAKRNLGKSIYQPVEAGERSVSQAMYQMLASGLDAGYKGAQASVKTSIAKESLRKLNKREVRAARRSEQIITPLSTRLIEDTADAAKEVLDGTASVPESVAAVTTQANLAKAQSIVLPESAPVAKTPLDMQAELKPVGELNAKSLKKSLAGVDKVIKTITGVGVKSGAADQIRNVLKESEDLIPLKALSAENRKILNDVLDPAIRAQGTNVIDTLRRFANGTVRQQKEFIGLIGNKLVSKADGTQYRIIDVLRNAEFDVPYTDIDKNLRNQISGTLVNLLKASKNDASIEQYNLFRVSEVANEETASKLLGIGALSPAKKTDVKKLEEILTGVGVGGEKTYANFDELVKGLKAMDQVDVKSLQKIIKAIDPDHAAIRDIDKAMESPNDAALLRNVIIGDGYNTIAKKKRDLALLDPETIFDGTNVPFKDVAVATINDVFRGSQEISTSVAAATRDAHGEKLVKWTQMGLAGPLRDAAESLGRGMKPQFGVMMKNVETPDGGLSKLGEAYLRSKGATQGPEVVLAKIFNQHVSGYAMSSSVAKTTYRRGKKAAAAEVAGKQVELSPRNQGLIQYGDMAESVLISGFGVRPVWVRNIKDLKNGVEDAFHHYVTVPDLVRVMEDAGKGDIFERMYFAADYYPNSNFVRNRDTVSYIEIGNAVADVLFALERNIPFDEDAMYEALTKSSTGNWDSAFRKNMEQAAKDFIEFLKDPAVAEQLASIHKSKLSAEVLDLTRPAQQMASDNTEILIMALDAMKTKGYTSDAHKHAVMLDWFKKFTASSHLFNMSNGEVARATFRSVAQTFLELTDLASAKTNTPALEQLRALAAVRPADQEILRDFQSAMLTAYKYDTTGAGKLKNVSQGVLDKAETELTNAMGAYAKHRELLTTDLTPQGLVEWRKNMDVLQKSLDDVRFKAEQVGVKTSFWNGTDWVSADRYNHSKAIEEAARAEGRYIATENGIIDVIKYMTDSAPKRPTYKTYGAAHTAETKEFWRQQQLARRAQNAENAKAQAQETTMARMGEIEKALPDDELAQVARAEQEKVFHQFDDGEIKVTQEVNDPVNTMFVASTYETSKLVGKPGAIGRLQRAAEKMQQGYAFDMLLSVLNKAESTTYQAIGGVDEILKNALIFSNKHKLSREQFGQAMSGALAKREIGIAGEPIFELTRQLRKIYDEVESYAARRGLDAKALNRAFKMRGLTEKIGMPNMDEFGSETGIARLFQLLPIAETPDFLVQASKDADPAIADAAKYALENFNERRDIFAQASNKAGEEISAAALFHNVVSAIQFAGREMTMADTLVANFNYKADGLTLAAAKKSGDYVQVKSNIGEGGGFSITHFFGKTAEEGNYFHKDVARAIGALDRSYNYTFGKNMAPWLKNMMGVLSFFKTTQTTLRPGHLFANLYGDMSTNLMTGCSPLHIKEGFRLGFKFAGGKIEAEWKRDSEALFNQMASGFTGLFGRELKESDKGVAVVIGGKRVVLDDEYTIGSMRDYNVLTDDIAVNDSLGHYDELSRKISQTESDAVYDKNAMEKLTQGLNKNRFVRGYERIVKPAGDAVAYMSNGNRAATALRVMQSKNWSSADEMWAAVNKEVNTFHPSIQSLSAFERKTIRPMATYYTWLRGAHNAFVKMAIDHTSAMLIPSKVFYNQALANEMGPNSIGNLWGDKRDTPGYINYSVYGPTVAGPRGAMLYRPSILPLDIMDNWNLQYDPTKSIDQNAFNSIENTGRMLGKNINLVAQPAIEFLTGTDLATGKPSTVKDLKTASEELIGNIGTTSFLKGLGLYTPSNKTADSANPLTDRDREILRTNWLLGGRIADIYTPANIRNAKTETNARVKSFLEQLQENQQQGQ